MCTSLFSSSVPLVNIPMLLEFSNIYVYISAQIYKYVVQPTEMYCFTSLSLSSL